MKLNLFSLFFLVLLGFNISAQNLSIDENKISTTKISKSRNETEKRGVSASVHIFEAQDLQKVGESYVLKFETVSAFTCFGIGMKSSDNTVKAGDFKIAFKTEKSAKDKSYGHLKTGEGENMPEETATGLYWSELFFGYDETARKQLFIVITPPQGVSINEIRIDVLDLSAEIDSRHATDMLRASSTEKSLTCPAAPRIIERADWCGLYTACTNASYTPTTITPTHTVIHHGASPDTYTDGYAVVRSYWNYHVNTLGWSDIGYNYLFDKFGNVFLGRKNANYLTVDVQGAHAGNSNSKSIGINFLGNGDVSLPTTIQLQKVYDLLAWWFKARNITPNTSANLILQSGGTASLPRILGHKDTNIGGTACPGTTIYALLPTMRNEVVNRINACNVVAVTPSNLAASVGACPTNNINFSWTNSGTGWYIQVSTSSTFTTPYYKYVSGLTSYTGPANFVLQSDGVTPLTLAAGQTYYWRIWDNTSFYTGTPFTIGSAPAYPGVISGTTGVCVGTAYTYSIAAVSGATAYTWTLPNGATINSGQNTTSISATFANTSGNVAVSASNSCGASSFRTLNIITSPIASLPGVITGSASVCIGATNTYSIATVSNATSYTWTVPAGTTIVSGQNSTTLTVVSGATNGNISVSASNSCGTSALRTLAVTSNSAPAQAGTITGTTSVCSGTSYTYSIAAVPNVTSYTWTVPAGSTISAGQNSTSITVLAGSTIGNIGVSTSNSCGTSAVTTLALTAGSAPAYPGVISGTTGVCVGTAYTYSIAAVSGATTYTWTLPNGATINSGQNTTSISATFANTSGNVAVSASNACGASSFRTLNIITSPIASLPITITGSATVCSGTSNVYSISTVSNATSYTWTVPTGTTITAGQNSTSLTVNSGSTSGNISVSASNSCGTSALRTLAVTSNSAPAQAGTITGIASVCSGNSYTYTIAAVPNATSYTWTVPTGSTISAGQNSTSLTVLAGSTSGNVSVTATNSCGTSAVRTLAIVSTVCADVTKPTTSVTSSNLVSTNFTATFTDADNVGGSGLKNKFYQVTDLTGTDRRANKTFGFYNDNFNTAIHADWTASGGTWAVTGGVLAQQDQVSANTNLYTSVTQVSANQYLYNWKMKISGTGTNRRAGLHFFCEDASQSNRLNSYMVYFRADGNVVQIYEYLNNVMSLKVEAPCTVTAGVQYDYKVILNATTGEINVYQNDVFLATWTDVTPLTVGNQVSLRSGECLAEFDDFRVFKSRAATAVITVGNATTKEIRYQNVTQTASSGKIVTINTDIANNISLESSKNVNVDFFGPVTLTNVNDGTGADIATQISATTISANWLATTDPNNNVTSYSYAIGTTSGGTNILTWTNVGNTLAVTKTGLTLAVGTTYYVSVKSYNSSGLVSSLKSSNGVLISSAMTFNDVISEINSERIALSLYPNPTSQYLTIAGLENGSEIQIYDIRGQVVNSQRIDELNTIDVTNLVEGVYFVGTIQNGERILERFVKN